MRKFLLFAIFLLASCVPAQTPASIAVQDYLQALSDKDEALMLSHVCPDHEFDALLEFDALAQVETKLQDVSCQQVETGPDGAQVTCSGAIVSAYGGELFTYELTGRTYTVIEDGEQWQVCGYTK